MNRTAGLIAAALLFGAPLAAEQEDYIAYIEANLLSIFYHEFGHALIDVMDLPVFGQEEDAADTASILLIDRFFAEEAAQDLAYNAAFGFLDEAEASGDTEPAWWDEHGPDLQRYYNLVCLFYGADPETREDLAEDLQLPAERAEICADEFDLANASWGPVFDDLEEDAPSDTLIVANKGNTLTHRLVTVEVDALNAAMALPTPITVTVKNCGEANAFYDPGAREITMCLEYEDHLRALAQTF